MRKQILKEKVRLYSGILNYKKSCAIMWKILLILMIFTPLFCMAFSSKVIAQEATKLTLSEIIEIALHDNLNLRQSLNQLETQRLNVSQSRMDFYPSLSASISSSKEFLNGSPGDQSGASIRASLGTSINLFNGFKDQASYEKSKLEYMSEENNLDYQKQSIILSVINSYIEVLLKEDLINIEEENLATQQLLLERIDAMFKAGNLPVSDVLQQKADISQAELNLLTVNRDFQVYKLQLLNLLGKDSGNDIQFLAPTTEMIITQVLASEVDASIETILANRSDMKAQKYGETAAIKEIKSAKSGKYPSVSFSLSAGSSYLTSSTAAFTDQFINDYPSLGAGLSITIPVFDKFQTKTSIQKAKISLENQKLDSQSLKLSIRLEIESAFLDYHTAIKQRETAKAQLEYSAQAYEVSQARYDVGASTYTELSQVRSQYISAANSSTQADWNLLQKYAALCFYRGNIDSAVELFN